MEKSIIMLDRSIKNHDNNDRLTLLKDRKEKSSGQTASERESRYFPISLGSSLGRATEIIVTLKKQHKSIKNFLVMRLDSWHPRPLISLSRSPRLNGNGLIKRSQQALFVLLVPQN